MKRCGYEGRKNKVTKEKISGVPMLKIIYSGTAENSAIYVKNKMQEIILTIDLVESNLVKTEHFHNDL
jgi:hypothetical protein